MSEIKNPILNGNIKKLRNELNLTQKDFAEKLNIGRATLGNIEAGNINVTDRNIIAICDRFNVSENWLRTGEGNIFNEYYKEGELEFLVSALDAKEDEFKINFVRFMLKRPDSWWDQFELTVSDYYEYLKKK